MTNINLKNLEAVIAEVNNQIKQTQDKTYEVIQQHDKLKQQRYEKVRDFWEDINNLLIRQTIDLHSKKILIPMYTHNDEIQYAISIVNNPGTPRIEIYEYDETVNTYMYKTTLCIAPKFSWFESKESQINIIKHMIHVWDQIQPDVEIAIVNAINEYLKTKVQLVEKKYKEVTNHYEN